MPKNRLHTQIKDLEESNYTAVGKVHSEYFEDILVSFGGRSTDCRSSHSELIKESSMFTQAEYKHTDGSSFIHILQYQNLLLLERVIALEERLNEAKL